MSYITVESEKVLAAVKRVKDYIKLYEAQAAANILSIEAKKVGVFSRKPKGYEKALYDLEHSSRFNRMDWHTITWTYNNTWEICCKLERLAKNGSPVVITDDHSFIFDEWEVS